MKANKLSTKIFMSFFTVILAFALSVAVLGHYVIKKEILERAQTKVKNDLDSAREIYLQEIKRVRDVIRFTAVRFFIKDAISDENRKTLSKELAKIREAESLDVLTLVDASGAVIVRSRNPSVGDDSQVSDELVGRILSNKEVAAGTYIMSKEELTKEGKDLAERAHTRFIPTPKAKPRVETEETSGMMIRAGAPVLGYDGRLVGVLYGGTLLNRNYQLVDRIKNTVYRGVKYKGKDIGTATIFQGDLRISTNVKTKDGRRAIGTRVSEEVYEHIVTKGLQWVDRAFVVSDWFKTAYEPIKDIDGRTIGILYVGILEQPFVDMARNVFLFFVAIVSIATLLAGFLAFLLAEAVSRPVGNMVKATRRLSQGDFEYEVDTETGTVELSILAKSLNEMSTQLREREDSLKTSNENLMALNKRYLDLVGFVSHELKGIVATTIMNTAAVRDGLFGAINPKQKHSLEAVTKNLDYLRETVRKFLDLSRIEKGELDVKRTELSLREDVFDICLETFSAEIAEKQIHVTNNIPPQLKVYGDIDLLRIVANNLISNAIKYGFNSGKIILSSEDQGSRVQVQVYNDSRPIRQDEKAQLFKRFSRLEAESDRKRKGTGLGLFITREIILKHDGDIWIEPKENGNSFIFQIKKLDNGGEPECKSTVIL